MVNIKHIVQSCFFVYKRERERMCYLAICTMGDQKVHGKVLLNRISFIDCNENVQI